MTPKTCSVCGARFECGAGERELGCWCRALPAIMPLDFSQDCRCPPCLKAVIQQRIAAFVATVTPETAAESSARLGGPSAETIEGIDYEIDALGRLVFTKWFLLRRGYCCENGCRNCPYGFSAS